MGISIRPAQAAGMRNTNAEEIYNLDTHEDDPVPGKMDRDDIDTELEWQAYLAAHPEQRMALRAASPAKKVKAAATRRYSITGLQSGYAIQKTYIGSKYIYVLQRCKDKNSCFLSRCEIKGNTAEYRDHMVLKNFGHGQTLEWFEHKSKPYFFVACKVNTAYDNRWSMQIGRIEYEKDKVINDYTDICRLANLNYANSAGKSIGSVKRVDAALSSDRSKLLLWVQNTNNDIQLSYYKTSTINALLDAKENASSKYVEFKGNGTLRSACLGSFIKSEANSVRPNDSFQGTEFSNADSIYIAGGNTGETPKIGKMTGGGNSYKYSCEVTISHSSFDNNTEIEGLQLKGDDVYFGICDHAVKETVQYIYSIPKSAF